MDAVTAIQGMVEVSGKSQREVSQEIGKVPTFIGTTVYRRSSPRADTLARIAEACGFQLVLEGHGTRMVIDGGPNNESASQQPASP